MERKKEKKIFQTPSRCGMAVAKEEEALLRGGRIPKKPLGVLEKTGRKRERPRGDYENPTIRKRDAYCSYALFTTSERTAFLDVKNISRRRVWRYPRCKSERDASANDDCKSRGDRGGPSGEGGRGIF